MAEIRFDSEKYESFDANVTMLFILMAFKKGKMRALRQSGFKGESVFRRGSEIEKPPIGPSRRMIARKISSLTLGLLNSMINIFIFH